MFGDDALKLALCTCLEQGCTITMKLIAELDAALLICAKQSL
jgi:hypothetical protein